MKRVFTFLTIIFCLDSMNAQVIISGYMANPAGTDSPHEYVQLLATEAIDFSVNNYAVIWCNNGTATANGWAAGNAVSYKFNLTAGSVEAGGTFYVGGSAKLINGAGTTDISSANWIRSIHTGTTNGDDNLGNSASGGVIGNGGANADGIAVFATTTITATTEPIDAIFLGTGVGTAKPASGGYVVPTNDRYTTAQGTFGNGTNTFVFPDPASTAFVKLTGAFNPNTGTWTTPRTGTIIAAPTTLAQIAAAIALPVELTHFSAKKMTSGISLDWQTATETNNDFFELERGTDGRSFSKIVQIDGAGNSFSKKNYQFLDEKSAAGLNYYRLKQTDFDGKSTFSTIVAIDWAADYDPAVSLVAAESGRLWLKILGAEREARATIYLFDTAGRLVKTQSIELPETGENIELAGDFRPGIHALLVLFSSGKQANKLVEIR